MDAPRQERCLVHYAICTHSSERIEHNFVIVESIYCKLGKCYTSYLSCSLPELLDSTEDHFLAENRSEQDTGLKQVERQVLLSQPKESWDMSS